MNTRLLFIPKLLNASERYMIMNGRTKNYNEYIESLKEIQEPVVPRAKLDLKGIRLYAQSKGVSIESLTRDEKNMFITYLDQKTDI